MTQISPSPTKAFQRSWVSSFLLNYMSNPQAKEKKANSPLHGFVQQVLSTCWPQSSCQVPSLAAAPSTCSLLCTSLPLAAAQSDGQVFAACWPAHMLAAGYQAAAALFTCCHRAAFLMPWMSLLSGRWYPLTLLTFSCISLVNAWLCCFLLRFSEHKLHIHTHTHITVTSSLPLCLFFLCPWICLNKLVWSSSFHLRSQLHADIIVGVSL